VVVLAGNMGIITVDDDRQGADTISKGKVNIAARSNVVD